jgi:hypothetical protein
MTSTHMYIVTGSVYYHVNNATYSKTPSDNVLVQNALDIQYTQYKAGHCSWLTSYSNYNILV